jgi:toxin ParE1/3/4
MKPVEQESAATIEMEAAAAWYERRVPGLGEQFYAAFIEARAFLQRNPTLGSPSGYGTRKWNLPVFPYKIVYLDLADRIRIVAVAHHSRRPGYWRHRVSG